MSTGQREGQAQMAAVVFVVVVRLLDVEVDY
jgi:hypothetical protein